MDPQRLTKLKDANVLITGGLGMIGSTIAHKLVPLGANVTLLDACIEPYGANRFNVETIKDKLTIEIADIRDKKSIRSHVKGMDIVFNLAGQVSHNDSLQNPFLDADINYIGHLNVLEAVRGHSPHAKVLHAGSRLEFGKIEKLPVAEDHPLKPKTPYALNKMAAENLYLYYNRIHDIPVVCFRIANPYGPRSQMNHSKYCMINWFLRLAMEDRPLTIFGSGDQIRDYIYVDDLADAFLLAAASPEADGEVFNVGSGTGTRFKDMARMIIDTVKSGKIDFVPWPDEYINVETGDYVTDITKIKRMLNYSPKTGLAQGIESTFGYYKKFQQHYWKSDL
jgi:nucleoside-diphosphate-sugar epimerase